MGSHWGDFHFTYSRLIIGSFGENRFKIGLTRRLTPTDRVDELNNASVPFEFDIHATIYSENAPQLEAKLHERFSDRRLNLVNRHKEFFECSLDEIEAAVREHNADIEFVKIPEAKAYRQTLVLRSTSDVNGATPANGHAAIAQKVSNLIMSQPEPEGQVYIYANNQKYGPYTSDQTREYVRAGNFDAATSVFWREGMADWAPLAQLN